MTHLRTRKEHLLQVAKRLSLAAFCLAVVGFVGLKLYPLIHGPEVDLETLSDGASLKDPMIRISGTASYTKDLIVNGNSLALSPDGSFDEKLLLNPGYNLITVQARDRFGALQNHSYAVILTEEKNQTLTVRQVPPLTN